MFGHIHVCLRDLVLDRLGQQVWARILKTTKCEDARDFLVFHNYPDPIFYRLIDAVALEMGLNKDETLEEFGKQFFKYTKRLGYHNMIRNLAADLKSFIENLDAMHEYFTITQKSMIPPSFSCDPVRENQLILHYNSSRHGLFPWLKGMLVLIAKDIFLTDICVEVIECFKDFPPESRFQEHYLIQVDFPNRNDYGLQPSANYANTSFQAAYPTTSLVNSRHFINMFPYHFILDNLLYVKQCGYMIQKLCAPLRDINSALTLDQISTLVTPVVPFTGVQIKRFLNSCFTILLKRDFNTSSHDNDLGGILLRGQMYLMDDVSCFVFICSPRLTTLSEMSDRNLFLSDIPLFDVTRELILVNQQRLTEMEISKHLDQMTSQLQQTTSALEQQKAKVHQLLSQMLPPKVANQLLNGKRVEAEKFDMVTVLFSDIVTFTSIASNCSAMDVVNMLNALYSLFDKATETHKVYKVETIGDAYMVVAGAPEISENHAEMVAEQAMDMVLGAREVKSPVTGLPLQIRVGMHTGPVVAGVVGEKMPRFCFFGDTVNVASRMESHGLPGRIHCSPTTHSILIPREYKFEGRGEVNIKGKGLMSTYFLTGSSQRTMPEPYTNPKCSSPSDTEQQHTNYTANGTGPDTNGKPPTKSSSLPEGNRNLTIASAVTSGNSSALLSSSGRGNKDIRFSQGRKSFLCQLL